MNGASVVSDEVTVPLRQLAHGRTGDKGDRCSISVIAYHPEFWPLLVAQVTEPAVAAQFAYRRPTQVRRYLLPNLEAMNVVMDGVLDGGVNDALNLDSHGKNLSFLLLDMPIRVPAELVGLLAGPEAPSQQAPSQQAPSQQAPSQQTPSQQAASR